MLGLAHIKLEGAPMHPDDFMNEEDMSDAQYLRQLQAYKNYFKLEISQMGGIVRDRLLVDLK